MSNLSYPPIPISSAVTRPFQAERFAIVQPFTKPILTVTLNPAIDHVLSVPSFKIGEVQRATISNSTAGGKGINVARVLKILGAPVIATGFNGGANGEILAEHLRKEGILTEFVDISPGEIRTATILLDPQSDLQTVINEPGPAIAENQVKQFIQRFDLLIDDVSMVVFSGSLPPGCPSDLYAQLIRQCAAKSLPTLLDTSGEALVSGVSSKPTLIKPNREEAKALGVTISNWISDAPTAANTLHKELDLQFVVITNGADGAVLASESGVYLAEKVEIENTVSAVGSGDSFAAGLAYYLARPKFDPIAALTLASACGAANTLSNTAGSLTMKQITAISGRIKIDKVV